MLRYLFLGLNCIFLYLAELFLGGVTITSEVPEKADPGSEFTVRITIAKGELTGFAKLQQVLPAGFSATIIESNGASFTFNDHTVKLIWMNLPAAESFTVSYKVSLSAELHGAFGFGGKFSYLDGNQKRTVPIPDKLIKVGEEEEAATATETEAAEASCSRSFEQINDTQWKVHIQISKKGINGFAKIEDYLPEGISALTEKSEAYVSSFIDQKIKFVWMNLPEEDTIRISYTAELSTVSPALLNEINGEFSFLENNETRKEPVLTTLPVSVESLAEHNARTQEQKAGEEDSLRAVEEAQKAAETERLKREEEKRIALEAARKKKEEKMKAATKAPNATEIPAPETGVSYKVQICAGHKAVSTAYFNKIYHYSESKVSTETHQGWIKYTIGSYQAYKDARDRREEVTRGYQFPGPFVTAYNQGVRITVQEALMITKQQWYQ